jgi:hypothetical protein
MASVPNVVVSFFAAGHRKTHFPIVKHMFGPKIRRPKIAKILFILDWPTFQFGELRMRIAGLTFIGLIAVLTAATAPGLAKNSNSNASNANAQKVEEKPAAQGCHAYQQAADGSWVQLSCQQVDPTSQAPARHSSTARAPEEETK